MPETICLTKYTLETDLLVGLFCFAVVIESNSFGVQVTRDELL